MSFIKNHIIDEFPYDDVCFDCRRPTCEGCYFLSWHETEHPDEQNPVYLLAIRTYSGDVFTEDALTHWDVCEVNGVDPDRVKETGYFINNKYIWHGRKPHSMFGL